MESLQLEQLYRRSDFKRAVLLAAIVGTWLVAFNQGNAILDGLFSSVLYLRIFLDYATPFVVSSCTSILRNRSDHSSPRKAEP